MTEFRGFPSIGKGTSIPNVFFETVLPRLQSPDELLAFLWVARMAQEKKAEPRCISVEDLWAHAPARESFENLGTGRKGLEHGLNGCLRVGALLALHVRGARDGELVYFINNPPARNAIQRARAGQLTIRPGATVSEWTPAERPDIFRLYEEHIGTITPIMADKLTETADNYPPEWIEDAFREAAERNVRNWRYIERILESWSLEGHGDERTSRHSFEEQKRRYLGGGYGNLPRYR